jgi:hypothetical protein
MREAALETIQGLAPEPLQVGRAVGGEPVPHRRADDADGGAGEHAGV